MREGNVNDSFGFFKGFFVNEWIFLGQLLGIVGSIFYALRLGKQALIALIALEGVLANLFVVQQMSLFGLSVTCSDGFAVGAILALNLLQEYFGKQAAKEAVTVSFFALVFFALMSQIHLLYTPLSSDLMQPAFLKIFSSSPRILFASILTFYLVQQLDIRLFGFLQGKLSWRMGASLLVSQLFDTVLFSFLGLYGVVESMFDLILFSYLIKCVIIAVNAPLITFSKRFVKNALPL